MVLHKFEAKPNNTFLLTPQESEILNNPDFQQFILGLTSLHSQVEDEIGFHDRFLSDTFHRGQEIFQKLQNGQTLEQLVEEQQTDQDLKQLNATIQHFIGNEGLLFEYSRRDNSDIPMHWREICRKFKAQTDGLTPYQMGVLKSCNELVLQTSNYIGHSTKVKTPKQIGVIAENVKERLWNA